MITMPPSKSPDLRTAAPRATLARLRPPVAALVAVAALVGVNCLGPTSPARATTPDRDPFYAPPSPLEPGQPGRLLRVRASTFSLDPIGRTPVPGVRAWQILYESRSALGEPIAVSGTVLVPTSPWRGGGARPLISYGVGTRGVGDACAPSYTLARGTDYEGLFIKTALARGFAVAVSDMRGLGTPGVHTYEVGREQGTALLDAARAALRLAEAGLSARAPIGIMGYSQGGTSAGWAAQLAPVYAPELEVRGVAAGGVPADLERVASYLDGGPFVAFALLAAVGYDAAYPELDLDRYLNERGRRLLARSGDLCLVSLDGIGTFLGAAFSRLDDYVTENPLRTPTWQRRLRENRLGSTRPTAPVLLYHGGIDEIIPIGQARTLRSEWCSLGARVTWRVYPLAEHALGLVVGAGPALDFLERTVVRGERPPGNC